METSFNLFYAAVPGNSDTALWNFVPNSVDLQKSLQQVDRIVSKTRRRSSLLTTATMIILGAHTLLHVRQPYALTSLL